MNQLKSILPIILLLTQGFFSVTAFAAPPAAQADVQAGAALFHDKGCTYCHGVDLKGTKRGPAIDDIRDDKAWTPEKMTKQILNGGQKMPPFADSLSDEEIAQLVAYIRAKDRPAAPAPNNSDNSQPK